MSSKNLHWLDKLSCLSSWPIRTIPYLLFLSVTILQSIWDVQKKNNWYSMRFSCSMFSIAQSKSPGLQGNLIVTLAGRECNGNWFVCSYIFYILAIKLIEILISECVRYTWLCKILATQNGKLQIVQLMIIVLPASEELLNSAKMPWNGKLIDWLNPKCSLWIEKVKYNVATKRKRMTHWAVIIHELSCYSVKMFSVNAIAELASPLWFIWKFFSL